jgi:exonuclease III
LNDDPYSNLNITSKFYDINSLSQLCANGQPIYLSLNIQSLNGKFEEFKQFVIELQQKNVNLDVIALQETWDIQYPDLLSIPGSQTIVYKNRRGMRVGGVSFYVKDGLNFKILNDLSPFEEKIFESISIQLSYPGKQPIILTSGYRSNGNIANVTPNQQVERFFTIFEDLMQRINHKNLSSFIFLDSNFDLLSLQEAGSSAFLNSILSAGYLQCIFKANRMHNILVHCSIKF